MIKSVFKNVKSSVKTLKIENLKDFTEYTDGFFVNDNEIYSGVSLFEISSCPSNTESVFTAFGEDYAVTSDGWVFKRNGEKFIKYYYGIFSPVKKIVEFSFGAFPSFAICSSDYITVMGGNHARINSINSVVDVYGGTVFKGYKNLLRFGDKFDITGGEKGGDASGEIRLDSAFGEIVSLVSTKKGLYVFQEYALWLVTGEDRIDGYTVKKLKVFSSKVESSSTAALSLVYFIAGREIYSIDGEKVAIFSRLDGINRVLKCASYNDFYVVLVDSKNETMALLYDTVSGNFCPKYNVLDVSKGGTLLTKGGKFAKLKKRGDGEWRSKEIEVGDTGRAIISSFEFYSIGEVEFSVISGGLIKTYLLKAGKNRIDVEIPACKTRISFKSTAPETKISDVKIFYRD